MKNFLKKNNQTLAIVLVSFILGLLFIILGGRLVDILIILFAILIIVSAVLGLITGIDNKNNAIITDSVINLLIGIVLLVFPISWMFIVGGALLIGINLVYLLAEKNKKEVLSATLSKYIVGAILIIYGIFFRKINDIFFIVIGILMIVYSIVGAIDLYKKYQNSPLVIKVDDEE